MVRLDLMAVDREENLGIIIASLPIYRRPFSGDLGGKRVLAYLSRFIPSTKQFAVDKSQVNTSNGQKTVADRLVPLKDINVPKSLEVQFWARTPSGNAFGHGSDPDDRMGLSRDVPTAIELV